MFAGSVEFHGDSKGFIREAIYITIDRVITFTSKYNSKSTIKLRIATYFIKPLIISGYKENQS